MAVKKTLVELNADIQAKEKTLMKNFDDYLSSNRRVDRDKVMRKREEIRTLKTVRDEFF